MKIGVDIGGSHVGVGIVNEEGKIVIKKEQDIKKYSNSNINDFRNYLKNTIIYLINESLREVGAPMCVIEKIGIAVPRTSRKWNSKKSI